MSPENNFFVGQVSGGEICGPPDTMLVDGGGGSPSPIICTDSGSKNRLVANGPD